MAGETNLDKLISNMEPVLNQGEYVFTTVQNTDLILREIVVCEVKEKEGITVVLSKKDADTLGLKYDYISSWITLNVHSSLEAVGLTAAFSAELGKNGISCNVIAGYFHDHIFIDVKNSERAFNVLLNMTMKCRSMQAKKDVNEQHFDMHSDRLAYRKRTKKLVAEMLSSSRKEQMLFYGFERVEKLEYRLAKSKNYLTNNIDNQIFDLVERNSKIVVGSCGFHKWDKEHRRGEIGYEIHEKYQNKGYMSEAIRMVIDYGFKEMNLNRIEALISPKNNKSIKLVEKNAFQKEGIQRGHYKVGDEFEDSIMYSLLKSEYKL